MDRRIKVTFTTRDGKVKEFFARTKAPQKKHGAGIAEQEKEQLLPVVDDDGSFSSIA